MKVFLLIFLMILVKPENTFCQSNSKTTESQTDSLKCLICPEDSSNFKTDVLPEYFLLGVIDDTYRLLKTDHKIKNEIDLFYPYEKPLFLYIVHYIEEKFKIKVDTTSRSSGRLRISSGSLARMINKFYDKDGALIVNKFNSNAKAYSFLLGNFYRHGEKLTKNIYKIQVFESVKDGVIYPMLKRVNCDKILYKNFRDYIPSSDLFYFAAPPRLIKYFNLINTEKEALSASYYQKITIPRLKSKNKELLERWNRENLEEIYMITKAFEYPE